MIMLGFGHACCGLPYDKEKTICKYKCHSKENWENDKK